MFHNTAFLVALNGSKPQLDNIAQAKDYTVGTIRSYYSEAYLKNAGYEEHKNLSLSVKYQHLWQMLFNKRIDFVLTNTFSLNNELDELGLDSEDIEQTLELTDFPSELKLAGNLSLNPSTASALKSALKNIKANGDSKILKHWNLN